MIILLIWITSAEAKPVEYWVNLGVSYPITRSIKKLQPLLSWKSANKHANIIYKESKKTGIPWELIVSIAFQESSFIQHPWHKICGLEKDGESHCVYSSLGPMHVNYYWWGKELNINTSKILNDLDYGYLIGVKILSIKYARYSKKDNLWWARFHSNIPKRKNIYANKIKNHIKRINKYLDSYVTM